MKLTKNEREAADWLCRAQDITADGGISKYYEINKGWEKKSYKEVSGYIIPTFFELYHQSKNKKYWDRALRIANWEVKTQENDGKWEYVFDTGQILIGLSRTYKETRDKRYKDALIKAADWLVKTQDSNGSWKKNEFALGLKNKVLRLFGSLEHSYNSRTAWALLEIWNITKNKKYKNAAIKNLDWAVSKQLKNGYYKNCYGYTHYLTYTASGLLEGGIILKRKKYIDSARLYSDKCLEIINKYGIFQGNYDKNWNPIKIPHICLTSCAQLAIVFYRLFYITKEIKYRLGAEKLLEFLKSKQDLENKNLGIKGGIAGSDPIDGFYCPNTILSWATKFYLDALLIQRTKGRNIKS